MEFPVVLIRKKRRSRKLVIDGTTAYLKKRTRVHRFELPPEVAEWARRNIDVLDWLVFDSPLSPYLRHPMSVRTMMLLLYVRAKQLPIAQFCRKIGIAHEQLYRIERRIKNLGLEPIYSFLRERAQEGCR